MSWITVHMCVSYCSHWSSVDRKKKYVRPKEVLQMPVAIIIWNNRSQGKLNTCWVLLTLAYLFEIEHLYLRVWIWTFSLLCVFLVCHLLFFFCLFVGCLCTRLTSVTGFTSLPTRLQTSTKHPPHPSQGIFFTKEASLSPVLKIKTKENTKTMILCWH